jgi:glycosyltransferase involved in cell wall biosynthesis
MPMEPRRPIRIVYVSPTGEIGGMETNLLSELGHLDRERFTPFAVCLEDGPFAHALAALTDQMVVLPRRRLRNAVAMLRTITGIARFLRTVSADVVVSENALAHLYANPAARSAGCQSVLRIGGVARRQSVVEWVAYRLRAARVIANSRFTADYLSGAGVPEDRLVMIYRGIDRERMRPDGEAGQLRARLGIPAEATLIAVIGRLQRSKGQHVFLQSARHIHAECSQAMFLVVGNAQFGIDQGFPEELRALSERLGLGGRTVFTGFRADIANVLSIADIVVTPAIEPEGFGMTTVEAMAAGKPLVATSLGATAELVTDGETGLLVKPDDAPALADAVLRLIRDEALRVRLACAAQRTALEQFSIARAVHAYQRTYAEALG